jgi:hypothetical protein
VEINSGIFVCGSQSFLTSFRSGKNCSSKPVILEILAIIGLFLAFLTGFIILFFFRNYEFDEKNLLKRRFNFIIVF